MGILFPKLEELPSKQEVQLSKQSSHHLQQWMKENIPSAIMFKVFRGKDIRGNNVFRVHFYNETDPPATLCRHNHKSLDLLVMTKPFSHAMLLKDYPLNLDLMSNEEK